MKLNKRVTLSLAGVLTLGALVAVIGTVAFFTDTKSTTNTFTVGNVKIDLIESYLHRVNAGKDDVHEDGDLYWSTDTYPLEGAAGTAPGDSGNWTGAYYTDAQILANSDYQGSSKYADYLSANGRNLVPGKNVKKMPYVINTGNNDAYVRVRVLAPKALDDGIVAASYYTGSVIPTVAKLDTSVVTRNNKEYNQYTFTYNDPVKAGQMTFWNVWGSVKMGNDVTSDQVNQLISNGDLPADGSFGVIVEADAIQADGFANAETAFNNFN